MQIAVVDPTTGGVNALVRTLVMISTDEQKPATMGARARWQRLLDAI
jgi:hypothetical protein